MNVPASLRSDQVAVMPWIGWPLCTGLDGWNGVDQVAGITGMRSVQVSSARMITSVVSCWRTSEIGRSLSLRSI